MFTQLVFCLCCSWPQRICPHSVTCHGTLWPNDLSWNISDRQNHGTYNHSDCGLVYHICSKALYFYVLAESVSLFLVEHFHYFEVPWPSGRLPQLRRLLQELCLASDVRASVSRRFCIPLLLSLQTKQSHKASSRYSLNWQCVASRQSSAKYLIIDSPLAWSRRCKTKTFSNYNRFRLEMLLEGFKQGCQ